MPVTLGDGQIAGMAKGSSADQARQPDPEDPVTLPKLGMLDRSLEHSQLVPQGQILGDQRGTTGKEASNEEPNCLKSAHPWTCVTEPNSRIVGPMRRHGNGASPLAERWTEFSGGTDNGIVNNHNGSAPSGCL